MKWLMVGSLLLCAAAAAQPPRPGGGKATGTLRGAGHASGLIHDNGRAPGLLHDKGRGNPIRLSPAEAAQKARRQHGGKVLSVSLQRDGEHPYYRVKLLDNGSVRIVHVPAD